MNKLTTLYLVRHGESEWNPLKMIQGQTNVKLTKKGEKQAMDLLVEIKDIHFDSIYASDLDRTIKTAEILNKKIGRTIYKSADLRQRNYADLEGKPYDVLKNFDSTLRKLNKNDRLNFKYSDIAESDKDVLNRVLKELKTIARENEGKKILIVIHGEVMRLILIGENFTSYEKMGFNSISNMAYIICESDGKKLNILKTKGITFNE